MHSRRPLVPIGAVGGASIARWSRPGVRVPRAPLAVSLCSTRRLAVSLCSTRWLAVRWCSTRRIPPCGQYYCACTACSATRRAPPPPPPRELVPLTRRPVASVAQKVLCLHSMFSDETRATAAARARATHSETGRVRWAERIVFARVCTVFAQHVLRRDARHRHRATSPTHRANRSRPSRRRYCVCTASFTARGPQSVVQ